MKALRNEFAAAAACLLLATGQATAQTDPPAGRPPQDGKTAPANTNKEVKGRVCRVTKLIDCDVKNTKGEKIGEIDDLVIDKSDARVAFAVLSFGGFLGINDKLFAIPFEGIKRTDDDKVVIFDASKEQLEKAPSFKSDTWPQFDRKYGTTVYDYYKTKPYWAVRATDTTRISDDALDKDNLHARGMCRASKAIGMDVEDAAGKNLGDIEDIVVDDANGRIVYAVLSFGGFLGVNDKFFAIPWRALKPNAKDDDKLVLDVPKDKLKAAPGFEKKNWPDMADQRWGLDIHKYYGQDSYWDSIHEQGSPGSSQR